MTLKRKLVVLASSAMFAVGALAAPAGAWENEPPDNEKQKCNAGRGNGSEGCDPGNSSTSPTGDAGQNQGGDECGPTRGGEAACPDKP
jgi:hypothetical protein